MMKQYTGLHKKRYYVSSNPLGRGGEGSVYAIDGNNRYVLKIYHDSKQTKQREDKLLAMANAPISSEALKQVAWPVDVVYDNGHFVGFVMPKASDVEELNVMYSGKYICTLSERITIAKNLCAAVNAVHEAGHVCGDLNPQNITVNVKQGTVMLVDTDSYHILQGTCQYRCEVGRPEYLPAEVQAKMRNGMTLSSAPLPTYSKQSDCFAIAVHIFSLLMNGCHPFACATSGNSIEPPQPIENIQNGYFPFSQRKTGLTTPAYAPKLDYLPKDVQKLFNRAFINGYSNPNDRPSAIEWYFALEQMGRSLQSCSKDKKHQFPTSCSKCPWCEVASKMNSMTKTIIASAPLSSSANRNASRNTANSSYGNTVPMNLSTAPTTVTHYGNKSNHFIRNGKISALMALGIVLILSLAFGLFNGGDNNTYNLSQAAAYQLSDYRPISSNTSDVQEYQIKANYSYEPRRYNPFTINLNGQFDRFDLGYYFCNPWGEEGGLRFAIYADGDMIFDTGYLPLGTETGSDTYDISYISINVSNVYTLELRADYNGVSGTYGRQYVGIVDAVAYKNN